jgi:hypothetical protein
MVRFSLSIYPLTRTIAHIKIRDPTMSRISLSFTLRLHNHLQVVQMLIREFAILRLSLRVTPWTRMSLVWRGLREGRHVWLYEANVFWELFSRIGVFFLSFLDFFIFPLLFARKGVVLWLRGVSAGFLLALFFRGTVSHGEAWRLLPCSAFLRCFPCLLWAWG